MFNFFIKKKAIDNNALKICFTGHRPKSLPWGYDETKESCIQFKKTMYSIVQKAILNGYTYFISGMALGIDMICAEIVLEFKKKHNNVILECAIPCISQDKKWSNTQQKRYRDILLNADVVHYVSKGEYTNNCMNNRNKYMVEQCNVVIAVWNGTPSGTGNTIQMAKSIGKKIRLVNPFEPK